MTSTAATDRAREPARTGRPWALAVWQAAKEYGCPTAQVTAGLGHRRRAKVRVSGARRWWED